MDISEIQATIHAYWTVVLFVVFIGIWIWAWGKGRKKAFDEAANLPLEDDMSAEPSEREVKKS